MSKKRRRYVKWMERPILEMFEMGHSAQRISTAVDCPAGAVTKVIRECYPDWDGRKYVPVKELVKRYKDGETMESLSENYNITIKTIRGRLVEQNVEIRDISEIQTKHHFNHRYFETIDSSGKAYWLGFLFADGNVSSRLKDVALTLHSKDEEHLHKFLECIEYDGPGAVYDVNVNGFGGDRVFKKICLRSEQMCADLITHGCTPNKSFDLESPLGLPVQFNNDFIRGVLDGDGYISAAGPAAVEIVGAYGLMKWIADNTGMKEPRPHKSIWRTRANGEHALDIMRDLYTPGGTSLARKQERVNKYV